MAFLSKLQGFWFANSLHFALGRKKEFANFMQTLITMWISLDEFGKNCFRNACKIRSISKKKVGICQTFI